jgi:ribosomal protein S25
VDLGGLIVTPREEDFIRIDEELLKKILNEVSLDQNTFSILAEKIKVGLS